MQGECAKSKVKIPLQGGWSEPVWKGRVLRAAPVLWVPAFYGSYVNTGSANTIKGKYLPEFYCLPRGLKPSSLDEE